MSEFDNMCTHVELHIISTKCKNEKTNVASWRKMNDSHPQVGRYWHFGLVTDPTCFNGDGCNFRIKCISLLVIISASLPRRGSITGINTLHDTAQYHGTKMRFLLPTHTQWVCHLFLSCILYQWEDRTQEVNSSFTPLILLIQYLRWSIFRTCLIFSHQKLFMSGSESRLQQLAVACVCVCAALLHRIPAASSQAERERSQLKMEAGLWRQISGEAESSVWISGLF